MRLPSKIFAIAVVTVVASCGGSSDSPPGPLGKHLDDMHIAAIPLEQKQNVVKTQNDWSVSKMENAKAEADYNELNSQISVVKNELKAAKLAVDSAISNKKSAEASADNNRMNAAQKDLHTAELQVKAAEARVKYYEAYRNYLKKLSRYTAENMYWRESQYELAKSSLAQQSGKSPKDVQFDWFPKQEAERGKRAASGRDKAESEKQRAQSAREKWQKEQQSADQASGKATSYPDPMAPAVQPTTAGSATP
jgi:hypothetical protein